MSAPRGTLVGALRGVRVLDASRVLAGPFCGQMLGDLGADVIKVEDPGSGDETRAWGPPFVEEGSGLSAYFMACNRNKRSVAINLKAKRGRALFLELAKKSDILIENFRRDSAASLGLTAKDLHAVNPRLIICTISGFGAEGSQAARLGYDFVAQGLSGMMAMTGPVEGPPSKVGVAITDIVSGLYCGVAALSALHARTTSGHGYAIDIALIDCAVASMSNVVQAFLTSGKQPKRQGNAHLQIVPYELFATSDGWLVLAVGNDAQWRAFGAAVGDPAWSGDARFARNEERVRHRAELVPQIQAMLKTRSTDAWLQVLTVAKVPCGPLWDFAQLFASDLAQERRLKVSARRPDGQEIELIRSPLIDDMSAVLAPPTLGQDTDAVLRELLGLADADIQSLKDEGAL